MDATKKKTASAATGSSVAARAGATRDGGKDPKEPTRVRVTDRWLANLAVEKRTEISDESCSGLRVRVGPTGSKTFLFKGRNKNGQLKTVTLGTYPELSLKEARAKAEQIRKMLLSGEDPVTIKRSYIVTKESPTLRSIVEEYRLLRERKLMIWARKTETSRCDAERAIGTVFARLLDQPAISLTADALSDAMQSYKPVGRHNKPTANGQVSRARAYLAPVFDWAAGRGRFNQVGRCRRPKLDVANVLTTFDPATDDPLIIGVRERTLSANELARVLPILQWPAPRRLTGKIEPEDDSRLAAMKWMLMTLSRREEVANMRWEDFDFASRTWTKLVKGRGPARRRVTLRLPDSLFDYLRSLPSFAGRTPDAYVFPNTVNGKLGNWDRAIKAVRAETGTKDWHYHDLRRTGSTILLAIGVAPAVVDEVLCHSLPGQETTSKAMEHYRGFLDMDLGTEDAQRNALDKLSKQLERMRRRAEGISVA